MSVAVFPQLAGLTYPAIRTPTFQTRKPVSVSGKTTRISDWSSPRYSWEIPASVLRQGVIDGVTETEFATLEGFFEQMRGGGDSFLYTDPKDNAVTGQAIGVGDGVTTQFQLVRTFGGNTIDILAMNFLLGFTVYVNGVAKTYTTDYTINGWASVSAPGVIVFTSPPGSTLAITADFHYYFPCSFDDDTMSFELFDSLRYQVKSIKFTSIK